MPKGDDQRTLVFETPYLALVYDRDDEEWVGYADGLGSTGWYVDDAFCWYESKIDLSGYTLQKKTVYPYTSFEQKPWQHSGAFAAVLTKNPYLIDVTLMSSVPIDLVDLASTVGVFGAPGFIAGSGGGTIGAGKVQRTEIIHGEYNLYGVDSSNIVGGVDSYLKHLSRDVYSSLEPTASDTLYCYRMVYIITTGEEGINVQLPPKRVILPCTIGKEPKEEYMMRLKRSYELANQV